VDAFTVFGLQTLLSFVVFGLLAGWYVWPWLKSVDRTTALTALTETCGSHKSCQLVVRAILGAISVASPADPSDR
jgi:hypothetical protein